MCAVDERHVCTSESYLEVVSLESVHEARQVINQQRHKHTIVACREKEEQ
jgi:hypothetical protein